MERLRDRRITMKASQLIEDMKQCQISTGSIPMHMWVALAQIVMSLERRLERLEDATDKPNFISADKLIKKR
jgi:hypothetical protein